MDESLVCFHFAMSNLPRIGIETMARDDMRLQEEWRMLLHPCGATFKISFGVRRGLPRLHFLLLILPPGSTGPHHGKHNGLVV